MPEETTIAARQGEASDGTLPLGARVLREALATPAFRELLRLPLQELPRGEGSALVRTLLREEPELWMAVVSTAPGMLDELADCLLALGRELSAMPPALVDAYLAELIAELNAGSLRALPKVWTPLLARTLPTLVNSLCRALAGTARSLGDLDAAQRTEAMVHLQQGLDPEAVGEVVNGMCTLAVQLDAEGDPDQAAGGVDWPALVRHVDHGTLREGVKSLSGMARRSAQPALASLLSDPVAVANLVLALPAVANDGVRLLAFALDRLDLPEELLASALFNVLREMDRPAMTDLIHAVCRTLTAVHRGSATLGFEEPAFKAVFAEVVDGLLDRLDPQLVGDAIVALGEDAEVMARVLSRRLSTDPALLGELLRTGLRLANVALTAMREVLTEAEQLPEATLQELGSRLPELDPLAVGRLLSQALRVAQEWQQSLARPGWLDRVLGEVDWDAAGGLLWRGATPLLAAYVATGWREIKDRPEEVGSWINSMLARFNQHTREHPERTVAFVPRLLSAVDSGQFTKALRTAGRLLGGAAWAQAAPLWQTISTPPWRRRAASRPANPQGRSGPWTD